MRLLLSGYLSYSTPSLAEYALEEGEYHCLHADAPESPSFLCRSGNLLFAGLEREQDAEILMYTLNKDGFLISDQMTFKGTELCHISYSPKLRTLFASCYGDGLLVAVEVEHGHFGSAREYRETAVGQLSRFHCCETSPDNRFVYAVNIAQNRIYCYRSGIGELLPNPEFRYLQLPEGEGPRHFCFHSTLPLMYLVTEYTSRVFTISIDAVSGRLDVLSAESALAKNFSGESYGSCPVLSANQRFLYVGNRGANTIGVFTVASDGQLSGRRDYPCGGIWPRHIALSQDQKTLLCANQRSNDVALLPILADGGLGAPTHRIPFYAASYVEDITK